MKKHVLLFVGLVGVVVGSASAQTVYANQQLMSNPFMTGGNYTGWTPNGAWRNDGGASRQVFDFTTTGATGFFSTVQDEVDFKTTGNHTADINYDVNTAELTGLNFNGVFLQSFVTGNAGPSLDASFFIELDIITSGGTYRAKSSNISDPWSQGTLTVLSSPGDYSWQGGSFLGDPFAGGGGIVLSEITDIQAKNFMRVITNNSDGSGTVFTTIDNVSIEYDVTVVPEPSAVLLIGMTAVALLASRRFFRS